MQAPGCKASALTTPSTLYLSLVVPLPSPFRPWRRRPDDTDPAAYREADSSWRFITTETRGGKEDKDGDVPGKESPSDCHGRSRGRSGFVLKLPSLPRVQIPTPIDGTTAEFCWCHRARVNLARDWTPRFASENLGQRRSNGMEATWILFEYSPGLSPLHYHAHSAISSVDTSGGGKPRGEDDHPFPSPLLLFSRDERARAGDALPTRGDSLASSPPSRCPGVMSEALTLTPSLPSFMRWPTRYPPPLRPFPQYLFPPFPLHALSLITDTRSATRLSLLSHPRLPYLSPCSPSRLHYFRDIPYLLLTFASPSRD